MPQSVISTPLQSRNRSPLQARLPTALSGRRTPQPIATRYIIVTKELHGLSSYLSLNEAAIVSPPNPDGLYPMSATALEWAQQVFNLFANQVVTFTVDGVNYTHTSSLSGAGECPVATTDYVRGADVYGATLPFIINEGTENKGASCDVDSDEAAHYGAGSSAMNTPVSPGAAFGLIESNMINTAFGAFPSVRGYGFNEPVFARRSSGVGGLNPSDYDMAFGLGLGPGPHTPAPTNWGGVSNATVIGVSPNIPSLANEFIRWRGQTILPIGNTPLSYFIARLRETFYGIGGAFNQSISGGARPQLLRRLEVISTGTLSAGQTIGYGGDIALPDPGAPSFFDTLGPDNNPVAKDAYIAILGETAASWAARFGYVLGDDIQTL